MSTTKHLLHEIADPHNTLPDVQLTLESHDDEYNTYAASALEERIGHIRLGRVGTSEPFAVRSSFINEGLRRQGYGFTMYLGAAALAYDAGYVLSSDPTQGVSRQAAMLWMRLQNRGLAYGAGSFSWPPMEEQSGKRGRARFVVPEHLEPLRPIRSLESLDDIWQDA